jgi:hypothetical protein
MLPTSGIAAMALIACIAWLLIHHFLNKREKPLHTVLLFCAISPFAIATSWSLFQLLARFFWLAGAWPLWVAALVSGCAMEGVALLYKHECRVVSSRISKALIFCRLTAIAIAIFMLLQPVYVSERTRQVRRRVAVLADESASMGLVDTHWRLAEVLDMSQALGLIDPSLRTNREARTSNVALWDGLSSDVRDKIRKQTEVPRTELSRHVLFGNSAHKDKALIPELRKRYDVDLFRFGNGIQAVADLDAFATNTLPVKTEAVDARETAFRSVTDMTRAMEEVTEMLPSEELAGVLFLTDGRHTGEAGVAATARRLAKAGIPISSVVIGGTMPPFDLSIADVRIAETVFLGDRVRMAVTVRADAAKGRDARIRLFCGEEQIAEDSARVETAENWTHEFRFTDLPKEQGLRRYRIVIDPMEGETLKENNQWTSDVYITDDRTNVLLVDNQPRWEYRYLRNLFYGRDKSVHLQFVLMKPDLIDGLTTVNLPPASASRPFGEAEAGSLPLTRDEWRMFDVIILGDLGDDVLTPEVVGHIRHCVEERGALLVVIAGPQQMPYGIKSKALQDLLPIVYKPDATDWRKEGESQFRIKLSASGRSHDLMRMSSSSAESEQIWSELPSLNWRLTVQDVKPGAEVLAYATSLDESKDPVLAARRAVSAVENDPEEAVRRLAEVRKHEARNALVVAQQLGQGKIVMLMTDRTWRLRYRTGDTLHHRFWGQVVRWGTGEKMRAGNAFVRLGTDRLNYTPLEPVRVMARLTSKDYSPITQAQAEAILSKDGKEVSRIALSYRKDSNGIYEGNIDPLNTIGSYSLKLHCPEAKDKLGDQYPDGLETHFSVITSHRPAELISVTASMDTPAQLAQLSGGKAVTPGDMQALFESFGEGNRIVKERIERNLWDSWWLFLAIVILLSTEWLLRKKGGLA